MVEASARSQSPSVLKPETNHLLDGLYGTLFADEPPEGPGSWSCRQGYHNLVDGFTTLLEQFLGVSYHKGRGWQLRIEGYPTFGPLATGGEISRV